MSIMWAMEEPAPYRPAPPPRLGELVRHARLAAGLTQAELAERAGLSERGISDIERGVIVAPNRATLQSLISALHLPDHTARAILEARGPRTRRLRAFAPSPLRVPLTPLVDRVAERTELARLLRAPDIRLISLLGPGGIGKSRLALAVAHTLARAFDRQVAFVELEKVTTVAGAVQHILAALNVPAAPGAPLETRVLTALRGRDALLVLDNVEHLPLHAFIVDLLTMCPGVRLLVTSRTPLRIRGEHRYPVTALALPEAGWLHSVEELEQAPATALFLQTARRLPVELDLSQRGCAAIARICRLAEGVPLRIEHAASLLTTWPLLEIARQMRDPLACLRNGPDDLPERHKSLAACVRWSYDLLPAEEQWLLRLLATIEGDFTEDVVFSRARRAASSADSLPGIVERLGALVEKHLLTRKDDGGIACYHLPDHIRAFVRAQFDLRHRASTFWAHG